MKMISLEQELKGNLYPGRGIVIGRSADGTKAVAAYFIMGRSENSRNRVFVEEGQGIRTQAFDPSKLVDPSLIIYAPVRVLGNKTIVTNGDQTDTIYEGMDRQLTFEQSLTSREFEPDAPNYTPRISGVMHIENGVFDYAMSILKATTATRIPATVTHSLMEPHLQEKDILFIRIWAMAIRCQVLRANRNSWQSRMRSMDLPACYGKA